MITDFFIASKDEALSINENSDIEKFKSLKAKKVESVKLMTLEEIFTNEKVEILEPIKELKSSESWIIPISKTLIDKLLKLDDLKQIALKWSQTEEWILDNGNFIDLTNFLKSLKELAFQAKTGEKELFVLISL